MKKKKHKSHTSQNQKIETKVNSDKQGKEKKIEKVSIESKLEEAENQVLRALAETENLRKRYEREKEDLSNYVISNFAKEIISVLDNLHRALSSVDLEVLKKKDESILKLVEGIELTEKQITSTFDSFKIEKVHSKDAVFDPNIHQAMFEVETEEKKSGIVIEVIQDGYKIGERLLRPALVGVSKKKTK